MSKTAKRTLDYYREVLDKISFADRATFRKELRKAFRRLLPEERQELKRWFRTSCLCRVRAEEPVVVKVKARP
jgi:hypothetical protein